MQKELKFIVMALCLPLVAFAQAQKPTTEQQQSATEDDDAAFTFTEAQLTDDDNTLNTISIVGSNHNVYASEVGYRFSAARFKYRALGGKYNEMYINGNPVNDVERGEFNFGFIGGLNNQTRNADKVLPFEDNNFSMTALGGSNNYNFRPSSMPTGHRFSVSGANRNYTARAMYSYNSGVSKKGWIFSAGLTYRWANMETANVEGTFYNALSYYLGVEKILNERHSISLVTWGNPTERAAMSASTDEMYWIANNRQYNPNWGYQDGKKRSSRIVNSWSPAALFTWDWKINDKTKLTTSLLGKYSMYSSTRLSYNGGTNPAPDYYSKMPSNYYNAYGTAGLPEGTYTSWLEAYNYLKASEEHRQIDWDGMYFANSQLPEGTDAMYYLQAYHDDQLAVNLTSNLQRKLNEESELNLGITLSTNKGMHYQTLEDLLGAKSMRNINTYAIGSNYSDTDPQAFYDVNDGGKAIGVGDRFGYDYNILVNKASLWATYSSSFWKGSRGFISGHISGLSMQRDGKMRNGLFADNSYGKSGTAYFLDGGGKTGFNFNLGKGHNILVGMTIDSKAPTARTAFLAPQMNNDFVKDLKPEINVGFELGYTLTNSWLQASLNGYFNQFNDVTEYSMAYSDIDHSFTYISLSGIQKEAYGVELGLNFKVTDWLNVKALGTISEAKYTNNANIIYMRSDAELDANGSLYYTDVCLNKGMREGGTPLTAGSIDLSYHNKGWFIDLIGNYYDRIYLYYSPITRYKSAIDGQIANNMTPDLSQAEGKGGFMLDASIGRSMFLKKGRSLSINIMLTNILNNEKICTGGMEQNRNNWNAKGKAASSARSYDFPNNPKKFYAQGINGMVNVTYKF